MSEVGKGRELEVSFVIASRNEPPELLARTVTGLHETARTVPYEIVVVDDASDVPVELVPHERLTLLRTRRPFGTMRSLGLGCAQASGRVLVTLDAHMTFADDWLEHYLAAIDSRTLVCPGAWTYNLTRSLYFGVDLFWRGGVHHVWWAYNWRTVQPRDRVVDVPMVLGACYGLERATYEQLGGFSPHYRVWGMVEQDLSYRAWMSGLRVRCATRARVGHFYRKRRPEGTSVSTPDFRYNQLLFGHCQLEEELGAKLNRYLDPPPEDLSNLASPEVVAWRELVQSNRRRRDSDLLRGPLRALGRTLPVKVSKGTVRFRTGRLPASVLAERATAEERGLRDGLPVLGDPFASWVQEGLSEPAGTTRLPGGVVTFGDRALLLLGGDEGSVPALQLELLRAGAALHCAKTVSLDDAGRAVGHAAPLQLDGAEVLPEAVGSSFSGGRRPIDLVAFVTYQPGARWRLDPITEGAALLALLGLCDIAVGERASALKRLRTAVAGARCVRVRRGPARAAAGRLVRLLRKDEAAPPNDLSFVHFGTAIGLQLEDARWRRRIAASLPAGAAIQAVAAPTARFRVERQRRSGYRLRREGMGTVVRTPTLTALADELESRLHFAVARRAEEALFVHAGVVAVGDLAIVLPGRSRSGKSTLVRALVRAGARYLSDEYAVVDERGRVWPYPKALHVRNGNGLVTRVPIETLGGQQRYRPAEVALVVDTAYVPGSVWDPAEVSVGDAYLSLMDNAVRAKELPSATLKRTTAMASDAMRLRGPRPEAEEVARDLLDRLEAWIPGQPPGPEVPSQQRAQPEKSRVRRG